MEFQTSFLSANPKASQKDWPVGVACNDNANNPETAGQERFTMRCIECIYALYAFYSKQMEFQSSHLSAKQKASQKE